MIKNTRKQKNIIQKIVFFQKKNLCEKIIFDLNNIFKQKNSNYSFIEILKKTKFDLYGDDRNLILSFHSKALDLLEEINETIEIEKKKEIINNVISKLDLLMDNILSFNIYSVIFNKIEEIINRETIEYFIYEMNKFETNPYDMVNK